MDRMGYVYWLILVLFFSFLICLFSHYISAGYLLEGSLDVSYGAEYHHIHTIHRTHVIFTSIYLI